jgi:hypothetical protein
VSFTLFYRIRLTTTCGITYESRFIIEKLGTGRDVYTLDSSPIQVALSVKPKILKDRPLPRKCNDGGQIPPLPRVFDSLRAILVTYASLQNGAANSIQSNRIDTHRKSPTQPKNI